MPVVSVLLAAVLFGTTGTVRELGLSGADPLAVGALRLAIGGSLLGAIALLVARRPARTARPTARVLLLVVVAAAGVIAYQPAFFAGVGANGVAVGTLIALGSAPVCTGLAGWAVWRRRPGGRWWGCTALVVLGVLLLSGLLSPGAAGQLTMAGIAASLGAGAAYALYTLAMKGLLDLGWSSLRAAGAVFGVAGLIGIAEAMVVARGVVPTMPAVGTALWLGVATVAAAYVLFARGLERLPAATVATLTLAEPVVAGVLGVAVLGERIEAVGWVGAGLLAVSLAVLAAPRIPRPVTVRPIGPAR